jgi:hypothetical protein
MQQMIKAAIRAGGPAGDQWPDPHPHAYAIRAAKRRERRRASRAAKGVKVRGRKIMNHVEQASPVKPLQKLAGATRYYYDDAIKTVTIGFLDQKRRGLGKMHAAGFKIPVTGRMRKMMFAAGFPLAKGTTELRVPARPVVRPVFERERGNIIRNVREKTINNIYRYLTGKPRDWDKAT